jgi:hypothetical protein
MKTRGGSLGKRLLRQLEQIAVEAEEGVFHGPCVHRSDLQALHSLAFQCALFDTAPEGAALFLRMAGADNLIMARWKRYSSPTC